MRQTIENTRIYSDNISWNQPKYLDPFSIQLLTISLVAGHPNLISRLKFRAYYFRRSRTLGRLGVWTILLTQEFIRDQMIPTSHCTHWMIGMDENQRLALVLFGMEPWFSFPDGFHAPSFDSKIAIMQTKSVARKQMRCSSAEERWLMTGLEWREEPLVLLASWPAISPAPAFSFSTDWMLGCDFCAWLSTEIFQKRPMWEIRWEISDERSPMREISDVRHFASDRCETVGCDRGLCDKNMTKMITCMKTSVTNFMMQTQLRLTRLRMSQPHCSFQIQDLPATTRTKDI